MTGSNFRPKKQCDTAGGVATCLSEPRQAIVTATSLKQNPASRKIASLNLMSMYEAHLHSTSDAIISDMRKLVAEERRITNALIELIQISDERKIYSDLGYPSLYEWLVKDFGYSESAAYRRIQAARLLQSVPQAKAQLINGVVNVSTLAQVQGAIRAEEKRIGCRLPLAQKQTLVTQIQSKSRTEVEKQLLETFPESQAATRRDRIVEVTPQDTRLTIYLKERTMKALRRAQEILSHRFPQAQISEVIAHVIEDFILRRDPLKKKLTGKKSSSAAQPEGQNQFRHNQRTSPELPIRTPDALPSAIRNQVLQRDKGLCQYMDSKTGRKCESRHFIEVDHIQPRALGGNHDVSNLRCLCRNHNQVRAARTFNLKREQWIDPPQKRNSDERPLPPRHAVIRDG